MDQLDNSLQEVSFPELNKSNKISVIRSNPKNDKLMQKFLHLYVYVPKQKINLKLSLKLLAFMSGCNGYNIFNLLSPL